MNKQSVTLTFQEEEAKRLDKFLAEQIPQVSRVVIQNMIANGEVKVNDVIITKASAKVVNGDIVEAFVAELVEVLPKKQNIKLDLIYEDQDVLVINKPAGLVVHPGAGNPEDTLVNALLYYLPEIAEVGDSNRPGIVHRLDKDTSGVLIVAKNNSAYEYLVKQFKNRKVNKTYLALVEGTPPTPTGRIETRIGRDERNRQKMAVSYGKAGRKADTEYFTVKNFDEFTLLEVSPLSGRTHQIRVHLAFLGNPVVGDQIYGRRKKSLDVKRFFLHAHKIALRLPNQSETVEFVAPLPEDLEVVLEGLEK